ncbi:MAG: MBOAT family protein [Lachnospiraceae bacterium]|nr:MBOAT family protein [Lachnospiraceae bacterium]MDD3797062.1 MBOAT family protein [Lachnospiraceae bacterium]
MPLSSLFMAGRFSQMTSYFSLAYLAGFLPLTIIGYSIVPKKMKKYFLLLCSYAFFWFISGKLVVYLALSTLSVHYFGIWLARIQLQRDEELKHTEKENKKALKKCYLAKQRRVLLFAAVCSFGVLLYLKYTRFFTMNVNAVLAHLHLPLEFTIPSFLVPVGISFFTMQAVSYLFDVYRGTIEADDNLFRLGLFMSFFPQIVEGPICRYGETAGQLWEAKGISYANLTMGIQRILYGFMKKLVVADRLNPLIQTVFQNYTDYEGGVIAMAAVCYTVQLYMDFSGTMDAVIGTAQIFGITMPENFQRPFFSRSISEFWKRWHITLGAWFRDYIFYPVISARPMKKMTTAARKKIGNHFGPLLAGAVALFCVWLCNGLWHGAGWHYIFFGMYHFALILWGNIAEPGVKWVTGKLHIPTGHFLYRLFQIVRTGILVVIGELFFRAERLKAGFVMLRSMITDFHFTTLDKALLSKMGIDAYDLLIVGITLLIVLAISILNEKGIKIRETLAKQPVVLRWAVLYGLILFIVIFGAYGLGYIPVDPIYANF